MSDSQDANASGGWLVKSAATGETFGPVKVPDLVDWARQSRIFPEDLVSSGDGKWRPARTLAELCMDTVIATPDGRIHGPLHAEAAAALASNGKLPAGAKVFSATELLAGSPESAGPASAENAAEIQEALEALRRETQDALAEKDREIETLRASADVAKADAEEKSKALDAARAEAEEKGRALDAAKAEIEEKVKALDGVKAESEEKGRALDAAKVEIEEKAKALDAAKAEAEEAKKSAESGTEDVAKALDAAKAEAAEANKALEDAKAEAEEARKELEEQKAEMAELLEFSNARDRESKAAVAELERRIAEISAPEVPRPGADEEPIGDARLVQTLQERVNDLTRERCSLSEKLSAAEAALAVATRPLEADTALVKLFADEALDSLREALAFEKERNDSERTASVQRQNALHDRIADLERALRRDPGEKTRGELAEERSERTISQLRQELDALREQHKADLGRAGENARALEGRLQALQRREAAVREQLRRVEKRTADYDSLTSKLRRREEEIVEAEKQFGEARTQWQVVEQMLRRRIDELEHGAGSLFENETDGAGADQSRKLVLPGWVKNMK